MTATRLSPAIAVAIGLVALVLAIAAMVSTAPRLADWLAPPAPDGMLATATDPAADLQTRLNTLAASHGVQLAVVTVKREGDAHIAQVQAEADEARMLRFLQSVETAKPSLILRGADLTRRDIAANGAALLEAKLTIAARYAP